MSCTCSRDANNATIVHVACLQNQIEIVRWLMSISDLNADTPGLFNRTPLHYAADAGNLGIVKYLINEKHCHPLCQDANNNTTLHLASMKGHLHNIVRFLTLEKSCSLNGRNSSDYAPIFFHVAALPMATLTLLNLLMK